MVSICLCVTNRSLFCQVNKVRGFAEVIHTSCVCGTFLVLLCGRLTSLSMYGQSGIMNRLNHWDLPECRRRERNIDDPVDVLQRLHFQALSEKNDDVRSAPPTDAHLMNQDQLSLS